MVRKIQFIGNGLYGAVGVSQQAARLGIEQPVDKVAGRLVGGLANDAREIRGRYGEAAGIKFDIVLLLVVPDEEGDELLEQLFGMAQRCNRVGAVGNRPEYLQQHDVQQMLQHGTLVGAWCDDVAGELAQVVGQSLSQIVGQVEDGRLSLEKEERVLAIGGVGGQQPFEEAALAQQMQGHEVGALPGERYQQAGPEEQHVVFAHGVVAVVQREGGRPLPNQHHRKDVGKYGRYGVDVYQMAVHLETGQTVLVDLFYLVVFCEFTQSYNLFAHGSGE